MGVTVAILTSCLLVGAQSQQWPVLQFPTRLHIDVEPHAVDGWSSDRDSVANQWLDLVDNVSAVLSQSSRSLQLRVDIPRWYDGFNVTRNGDSKPLSEWTLDVCDVMIMDYVDDSTRFVRDAETELQYADSSNIAQNDAQISVCVETSCGFTYETTSFCEDNAYALEDVFDASFEQLRQFDSFEKVAVHYLLDYLKIPLVNETVSNGQCTLRHSADASHMKERALYVWHWEVIDDTPESGTGLNLTTFIDFCTSHCVTSLYLESQTLVSGDLSDDYGYVLLARLLNVTQPLNIDVELVLGYSQWALTENHADCLKNVQRVIDFAEALTLVDNDSDDDSATIKQTIVHAMSFSLLIASLLL